MSVPAETTQETEAHLVSWWLYPVINVLHAGCKRCFPGKVAACEAQQRAPERQCLSEVWHISLTQRAFAARA